MHQRLLRSQTTDDLAAGAAVAPVVPSAPPLKRALDVAGALLGLVAAAPLLALCALAIKCTSRGPVLYRQVRVGRHGAPFRIYKLRTMRADAELRLAEVMHLNVHARDLGDGRMYKIADDPRVTKLGRFLRRFSLDELPQLLNVLKGEMSLVGPRPLTQEEDGHVVGAARRRASVAPGLTGPWQVLGRNAIPFEEMMRLDCAYVTGWSFATDLMLLARTIPAVLRGEAPC
jgi:lipopolysaccharide/colanic/teichoic acid biosynthesis glycosyltransferase